MAKRAIGLLSDNAALFASTLITMAKGADRPHDRIAAAKAGFDCLLRLHEKIVLEERVAELEERAAQRQQQHVYPGRN
jgi:hypothetical protein